MTDTIIRTERLTKDFGEVHALKGVDLEVERGTVFGMLGPNGAGKTTTVRILATLLPPTDGRAEVDGLDAVRDAEALRYRIGLAGQSAAIDENLTGIENLVMVGELYRLPRREARRRGREVLERFDLADASDRPAKTYSGGMRRRLDLAASLVGRPSVLFLDEPTTGLDPRSRIDVWDFIRELQGEGTTLMLTTQYLEEADILAERIAVIDEGTVIAEGTPADLKLKIGGEVVEMHLEQRDEVGRAAQTISGLGSGEATIDEREGAIRIPVGADGSDVLLQGVRRLDDANIRVADIALHRPTLDDVFLSLTGHHAADAPADGEGDTEAESASDGTGRRGGRKEQR